MSVFNNIFNKIQTFLYKEDEKKIRVFHPEDDGAGLSIHKKRLNIDTTKINRSVRTFQTAVQSAKDHVSSFFSTIRNALQHIFFTDKKLEKTSLQNNLNINQDKVTSQNTSTEK